MTAAPRQVELKLLRQQMEFQRATETEVLLSGAVGAGKSFALCCKLLAHAQIPGNQVGLCRKTFDTIEKSTLETLLGILNQGQATGALPPYKRNENKKSIYLHGGGRIDYFGLDDIQKIGSYQWGAIGVDEASELIESDWKWLLTRIRVQADPNNQVFGATNPATKEHFLYQRFFVNEEGASRRVISTSTADNIHLPEGYIDQMGFKGPWYQRYIQGLWVALEGGIYPAFSRDTHLTEIPLNEFQTFVAGVDDGWTNPRACLVAGVDYDGRIHVLEEMYQSKQPYGEFVAWLSDIDAIYSLDKVVVDPSAAQLIDALQSVGLPVHPADNKVLPGIQRVQDALVSDELGRPRLTLSDRCTATIKEFEAYQWRQNRGTGKHEDVPVKENDHAMDALRYLVMAIHGVPQISMHLVGDRHGGTYNRLDEYASSAWSR